MKLQEMLERTQREVIISVTGTHGPKFEIVKPSCDVNCGWDLHVNPDSEGAFEVDCRSLDEAAAEMTRLLWEMEW